MDKYIYLLLSLYLIIIWFIFFLFLKSNFRKILIEASFVGGLAGLIAEIWYFKDYWRPLSVLDGAKFSPEDFLAGFAVTGIGLAIGSIIGNKNKGHKKGHKVIFYMFLIAGIANLLFFSNILKINSMLISTLTFLIFSLLIILIRKDLKYQSIMSGIFSFLLIIPIYVLLFDFISPAYWDKYWLLTNTAWGIKIIGNIPVTELFWYFSWGCFAGIAYDFYSGNKGGVLR